MQALISFRNHQKRDPSFHGAWFVGIKDKAVTQGTLWVWEAASVFLIRHSWSCSIVRSVLNRQWTRRMPKVNLKAADSQVCLCLLLAAWSRTLISSLPPLPLCGKQWMLDSWANSNPNPGWKQGSNLEVKVRLWYSAGRLSMDMWAY